MAKERFPLQLDMFTGETVDNRSHAEKRRDRERSLPEQQLMFRGADIFEFAGKPRSMYQDWLDRATPSTLELTFQDLRSAEEIEQAARRASQDQMKPLFPASDSTAESHVEGKSSGLIFDREASSLIKGLKAQIRTHSIAGIVRF